MTKEKAYYRHKLDYINKYNRERCKAFSIRLNKNKDADMVAFLCSIENRQGFLKELIRDAMNRAKD